MSWASSCGRMRKSGSSALSLTPSIARIAPSASRFGGRCVVPLTPSSQTDAASSAVRESTSRVGVGPLHDSGMRSQAVSVMPCMTSARSVWIQSAYGGADRAHTSTSPIDIHSLLPAPLTATFSTDTNRPSTDESRVRVRVEPGSAGVLPSATGLSTSEAHTGLPSASRIRTMMLYRRSGQHPRRFSSTISEIQRSSTSSTCHQGVRSPSPVWEKVLTSPSTACAPV